MEKKLICKWMIVDAESLASASVPTVVTKLPDNFIPLCTIIIGYPPDSPTPKDKWKSDNVSYNEFRK